VGASSRAIGRPGSRPCRSPPTISNARAFVEAAGADIRLYSNSEKWQRLNAVACVYEYEVDADDNYEG